MTFRDLLDKIRRYAADPRGLALAWRGLRDRGTVARSPLFDRAWYLREHPDVAEAGADPALHYLVAGRPAGLDPGPGFCGAEYLALHPDARVSGLDPLVHYERVGRRRGYRISFLQPEGREGEVWRFPTPEVASGRASFRDCAAHGLQRRPAHPGWSAGAVIPPRTSL